MTARTRSSSPVRRLTSKRSAALIDNLEQAPIEQRLFEVYKLRNQAAADVANALTSFITSSLAAYQVNGAGGVSYYTAYQQLQRDIVIVAEPVSNTILLSATPKYFTEMKRLIERLDAQPPQVVIQVTLADIQLTNAQEFGIEVGLQSPVLFNRGGLTSPGFNFNNVSLPLGSTNATEQGNVGFQGLSNLGVGRISTTGQGVGGFVFSASSQSFQLLIRALKSQGRVDILSHPQVQVMDNQAGFVQVGATSRT